MTEPIVAVDLGGTHVRAALVAADGTILARQRTRTPIADPTPSVIPKLIDELMAARSETDPTPERAVIGMPGIVDHEAEALVHAPNLPQSWLQHLNEQWLRDSTGLEVALANDADMAAVGESTFGAGRGHRDVVYVTISTGVGAGVVVADQLVRGTLSGGELGHTVVDRVAAAAGRACTVEDLGSGTAIERAAGEAGLVERGQELADMARAGHDVAADIWTSALEAVGVGIANLAWTVAPQVVVIGGGVGMNGDLVNPVIERCLIAHGPVAAGPIKVATASLGDAAGLSGAAGWWKAIGRG